MGLTAKECEPCRGGVAALDQGGASAYLKETPGWEIIDGARKIQRRFSFDDFASALAFANKVGEIAEQQGHHPDITLGWGYCTVVSYTHKIGGLHENDFILAAKINQLM
jgi:4a-hydroxytetrahydrobiopterin dehydratase